MNRRGLLLALGAAAGTTESCAQQTDLTWAPTDSPVTLATGESVGFADALAKLAWPELGPVRLLTTAGSVTSLGALHAGATLALAAADATMAADAGTAPV